MSESLVKKSLAVAIIFLFLGMSVPSTGTIVERSSSVSFDGKTLYVGGDGPGNYSKIQDAIDDANDGDTVFVYDDSSPYFENLVIDVSINLVGEDRDSTIIDGNESGNVIKISANHVNILCFTIQKSGSNVWDAGIYIRSKYNTILGNSVISNHWSGIYFDYGSNYNTIMGNTISNSNYGIYLSETIHNNTIIGNTVTSNNRGGILLSLCDNNTITGNNVSNNDYGIYLGSSSNSNTITGNNIHNNGVGIQLYIGCLYNTITGNSISNSNFGILLHCSYENTIKCNNIQNNDVRGLDLGFSYNNIIEENNFIGNKRHALFGFSWRNTWDANYWDNWIGLKINWTIFQKFPKVIVGFLGINFDWHPAKEPYEIGV